MIVSFGFALGTAGIRTWDVRNLMLHLMSMLERHISQIGNVVVFSVTRRGVPVSLEKIVVMPKSE